MGNPRVLIVEDDELLRVGLRDFLRLCGYDVSEASDCMTAKRQFRSVRPDVAIVDYLLPDGTALDLLRQFKSTHPTVTVMVLTGHGTIDLAVRAVKDGADQFVAKPIEFPSLLMLLERAIEDNRNRRKVAATLKERGRHAIDPFVGSSSSIRALEDQARRIAEVDSPVLVLGETGTGKSVLARWFHETGVRAPETFVDLNCAGLSKELLDTELFGHEKGAFTGAASTKSGLLEIAHRGTVFLDEIGDMDTQVQPKLLKVLEEKRFRRVGSVVDQFVDIRLIAATHQNLEEAVRERRFRSDLFFRISALPIVVPSLRERGEDVVDLARTIVVSLAPQLELGDVAFSHDAEVALRRYPWPGNIRELRNVLERTLLLSDGVSRGSLVLTEQQLAFGPTVPPSAGAAEQPTVSLAENERRYIVRVLDSVDGNVIDASRILKLSRSGLYKRMKKHGIATSR